MTAKGICCPPSNIVKNITKLTNTKNSDILNTVYIIMYSDGLQIMNMEPPTITKETIAKQVLQYLRQAILTDEFKSGQRLKETTIARALSVSRTPVREAIHMLEVEGLVMRKPNGHSIVANRSNQDMIEAFHVRIALESYAARLATEKANDEQLKELEHRCEDYENKFDRLDGKNLKKLGNDFHATLIDVAGNCRIKNEINEINDYIRIYRARLYSSPEIVQRNWISHREIFEAIKSRQADEAQEIMRRHLTQALEILNSLWQPN
jgi:DNA-binding GntR family transcriptional regulator